MRTANPRPDIGRISARGVAGCRRWELSRGAFPPLRLAGEGSGPGRPSAVDVGERMQFPGVALARWARLELATVGLENRCSIQLSYHRETGEKRGERVAAEPNSDKGKTNA